MAPNIEDAEVREIIQDSNAKHVSYETAIGKRSTAYYSEIFRLFDENPSFINTSFNWAAFFFSAYWAFYRKLYGPACLGLAVLILVPSAFGEGTLPITYLVVMIVFGVLGNSLYHRKVKRLLSLARIRHRSEESQELMVRLKGGVNMWVPVSLTSIIGIGVVAAVVLPMYEAQQKQRTAFVSTPPAPAPKVISAPSNEPKTVPGATTNDLGSVYYQRVDRIKKAALSKAIPITNGAIATTARPGESYWLPNEVAALERNQTWWMEEGFTYIHINNISSKKISTLSFRYSVGRCGNGAAEDEYTVQFQHFISPGHEGVVEISGSLATPGCLTIFQAWG
ncbi:DUF2628 domain-containing protein [Acidovorax sp. LjRoot66]|uniref:DUF2628 domain-containing protein n=1 Tax=Acidovorax sp. LjRoot66 TaxID=3342334 RepID=UPI003ECEC118